MKIKILLFCFLFSAISLDQISAEYQYTFTFSDEFNNSQDLILGKDPFGTDGIDTLFGEEPVLQVPPGEFGIRFQIPPDTSITTIKDIRFGCYWATGHNHLIDFQYAQGSSDISVKWSWGIFDGYNLDWVMLINPFNGQALANYNWSTDTSFFTLPSSLTKLEIWTGYGGTLSSEEYELLSPNGGEVIEAGENYNITWWSNQLAPWLIIEFSSDSGKNWSIIADSVLTTNNGYNWLIPNISSESCLIRLGNYPCSYDVSDSIFKITNPVSIESEENLTTDFSLEQNYPNPFNPTTKIKFTIPTLPTGQAGSPLNPSPYQGEGQRERFITLIVYDVLGNEVATLINEEKPVGIYEVEFNGTALPSGIYFYQLKAGSFVETKKMVCLK
ncbi:T9SS type A sorting domain-containing protein [Bacteroidota bacterium]